MQTLSTMTPISVAKCFYCLWILKIAGAEVVQRKLQRMPSLSGKISLSGAYGTGQTPSITECSLLCVQDARCVAMFFVNQTCYLTERKIEPSTLIPAPSALYFRKGNVCIYVIAFKDTIKRNLTLHTMYSKFDCLFLPH